MFHTIFSKTLYDKRWFLLGWSLGSIVLFCLTAAFYPVIADSIGNLLKSIPKGLESVVGEQGAYSTYKGFVGSAVYGVRGLMMFVPMALVLGISLGASEESSRKLYQLLAQPKSRRQIVWQRWWAGIVIILVIMALNLGAIIVTSLAIHEAVPYAAFIRILAMSALFASALFSLTYGLAVAFGRKGLALIIPIIWAFLSLLIDSFSASVDWLKKIDWLSLLHYYSTSNLVNNDINLRDVAVIGGVLVISLLIGLVFFPVRDIRDSQ